jgi:phosphonate transport system substrate-binding protein
MAYVPPVAAEQSELVMGVFPRRNPSEMIEMFNPLAIYLSRVLGRPVKIETTPDFNSFWEAVAAKRYDIVHYNQYHYIRSHKLYGYQVVAKNQEDGRDTIRGVILVRKDSGIQSLADLRGKTLLFGGNKQAMLSYIVPTFMLRQAGLKAGDYQEEFALNPPNVTLAVYFKRAVAGGTGDTVSNTPFVREKVDPSKLKILVTSDPVAQLPWAVRGDVSAELREQIRSALLAVKHTPEAEHILKKGYLTDITKAEDAEYDYVRSVVKDVMGEQY